MIIPATSVTVFTLTSCLGSIGMRCTLLRPHVLAAQVVDAGDVEDGVPQIGPGISLIHPP